MRLNRELVNTILDEIRGHSIYVTSPEDLGECMYSLGEYMGDPFFLYIYPSKMIDIVIFKIEPVSRSCFQAIYDPIGLYLIIHNKININEFIRKLNIVLKIHTTLLE